MQDVKLLGINDDVTTCECCGKSGLKKTVVIELGDCGSVVHYGTQCASKLLQFGAGARFAAKKIETEAKLAESKSYYAFTGPIFIA